MRLQKQHLKHSNSVALRDSIRSECIKQKLIQEEMNSTQEEQKMNILNYNNIPIPYRKLHRQDLRVL
jgi:hypothetical protein